MKTVQEELTAPKWRKALLACDSIVQMYLVTTQALPDDTAKKFIMYQTDAPNVLVALIKTVQPLFDGRGDLARLGVTVCLVSKGLLLEQYGDLLEYTDGLSEECGLMMLTLPKNEDDLQNAFIRCMEIGQRYGVTGKELASEIQVSPSAVYAWTRRERPFKREKRLQKTRDFVRKKLFKQWRFTL